MTHTERAITTIEQLALIVSQANLNLTGKQCYQVVALLKSAEGLIADLTHGGLELQCRVDALIEDEEAPV